MQYESYKEVDSLLAPGVKFRIKRMSFTRRLELAREIRELMNQVEFLEAGVDPKEQMGASLAAREVDQVFLRWGLVGVDGLKLDGALATPETLVDRGPENLTGEALQAIRAECGLAESERKN